MLKHNPIVVVERACEIKPKGVNKIIRGYKKCSDVRVAKKIKSTENVNMFYFFQYHKSITVKDYIYSRDDFSISKVLKIFIFVCMFPIY